MRPATLASLAILKVNWDERGHDYADNFLPFVQEAVRQGPSDQISVSDLQKQIRERFGLIIPQGALNTLLRRSERRGAVRREHGVFVRSGGAEDSDFQLKSMEVARRQTALRRPAGAGSGAANELGRRCGAGFLLGEIVRRGAVP